MTITPHPKHRRHSYSQAALCCCCVVVPVSQDVVMEPGCLEPVPGCTNCSEVLGYVPAGSSFCVCCWPPEHHRGVAGKGTFAVLAMVAPDAHVTLLSPRGAPAVLQHPVWDATLLSVAHHHNAVVQGDLLLLFTAGGVKNATCSSPRTAYVLSICQHLTAKRHQGLTLYAGKTVGLKFTLSIFQKKSQYLV